MASAYKNNINYIFISGSYFYVNIYIHTLILNIKPFYLDEIYTYMRKECSAEILEREGILVERVAYKQWVPIMSQIEFMISFSRVDFIDADQFTMTGKDFKEGPCMNQNKLIYLHSGGEGI